MKHPMRFGLKLSGQATTIETLHAVWRVADEAGFDHLWDFDHFAAIGQGGPDRPVYEGWAMLAAMAEATSRVRIGCMVTGNTYRHPAVLAKLAVTVDHLSGGRLEFGIGAAWAEIEHAMFGFDGLDHRVGRASESLRVIKSLWTQDRTTFEGRYYRLKNAIANPKPIQSPHPPIWIGAGGEQTIKLVARHADVWNPSGATRGSGLAAAAARLDEACAAIGRDPSEIRRSSQFRWGEGDSVGKLEQTVGKLAEMGFTEHIVYTDGPTAQQTAERVAEALPSLRKVAAHG